MARYAKRAEKIWMIASQDLFDPLNDKPSAQPTTLVFLY
jgi:hypothetical protein